VQQLDGESRNSNTCSSTNAGHTTVETNLAVQANRMNLIMKKVTSWAAVIVALSGLLYLTFKRKDWL
jgi:Mg2+ and Co2+ transporter CorA